MSGNVSNVSINIWTPLAKYLPEKSFPYVVDLLNRQTVLMKVTKPKKSRAGLYFYDEKKGRHTIYINGNLDKLNFLITFIHEYAHLVTRTTFGKSVKPHGKEWKQCFQQIMKPLIHPDIFPADVINYVIKHMKKPSASHFRDKDLIDAISKHFSPSDKSTKPTKPGI